MLQLPDAALRGLAWAGLAILIWSGSLVMLRLGVTTGLGPADLAALRFGVAAVLLAPVLWRRGGRWPGAWTAAGMVAGFGAPYVLLLSLAMRSAPAAAAGALNPGIMAIASVLLARVVPGRPLGWPGLAGIALTAAGLAAFLGAAGPLAPGHAILVATGLMWAGYAALVRWRQVPALEAAAVVATGSALVFLPLYPLLFPVRLGAVPPADLALQALVQGGLVGVVAVYAFNRSAELLGPVAGTSLPALIPVATLGLGQLLPGEPAGPATLAAAGLVTLGLALILAGPGLAARGLWRRDPALRGPR
ncbi:DMT family transporter [Poseidonocella sp. HB161398]|uniref:DMT family transporter n=1 Tax=Poseidonocella sp. HB161398 TaxID=2320855 RepID=UPI001109E7C7|nr:DMT family transporter [Poseidonocella sp. HB161398]